ncbi:MarR family transcriptional regulator [Brachyspira aalborgi]|uniref:MarR family transcriptional regulator n=1 Tax=Brachyspira aalborgi TaxID=29522 RepID=A0A5C8CNF0_9SPIR|nr:MarR family transcriptional regulator [Brachyspira aalborgi]
MLYHSKFIKIKNANFSDLSKRIGLERSTLVRNIQGLIKKGLIEEGG